MSVTKTVIVPIPSKQYMYWNVYKTSNNTVSVKMTDASNASKVYFDVSNSAAVNGKMTLLASGTGWKGKDLLKITITDSGGELIQSNNSFMVTSNSGELKGYGDIIVADDGSLGDSYWFNDIYIMVATWNTAG